MGRQDRIAGTLLAMAAGDALGAGYEFQNSPRSDVDMIGGGLGEFAPGEWTDDTAMALAIAQVTEHGRVDLEEIGDRFLDWYAADPPDVGNLTRAVLSRAGSGAHLVEVASEHFERNPRGAAGNGALMRTAPIALAHLGDDAAIGLAARAVASLTHADPLAGDSCVLWCIAIDRAIRERRLDGVHDGIRLPPTSVGSTGRTHWRPRRPPLRGSSAPTASP
jgi:ADP-ribosyl-[dinitrogen reductase] hydrolase